MCMQIIGAAVQAGTQVIGAAGQNIADMGSSKENIRLATIEKKSILNASNYEANKTRREGQAFLGQTRTIQAASGVDITTGSAADVGAESAKNIEMDALTELYRGRLKAWSKDVEIEQHKTKAKHAKNVLYTTLLGGPVEGMALNAAYGGR